MCGMRLLSLDIDIVELLCYLDWELRLENSRCLMVGFNCLTRFGLREFKKVGRVCMLEFWDGNDYYFLGMLTVSVVSD